MTKEERALFVEFLSKQVEINLCTLYAKESILKANNAIAEQIKIVQRLRDMDGEGEG